MISTDRNASAQFCSACHNTGKTCGSDFYDCIRCNWATEHAAFDSWYVKTFGSGVSRMPDLDAAWVIYQQSKVRA